jgi:DNA polymerase-1
MERQILKTLTEVQTFFTDFGKTYAWDTETTGLKYMQLEIEGASFYDGVKACYIPFMYRYNIKTSPSVYWTNPETNDILKFLKPIFETAKTSIAHNIVFDMKVIYKYGISLEGVKIYDTMIADHLIDEYRSHKLKDLAKNILGADVTRYDELDDSGTQEFADYAMNDAIWTYQLCMHQQPIMKKENLVGAFRDIEMPFQFCLLDMEVNGMLVDTNKVSKLREELTVAIDDFNIELHNHVGAECGFQATLTGDINIIPTINFNSGKVLQDILFNQLELEVIEQTPSGAPSTRKLTINTYKKTVPFVSTLNKYKIANNLLTSYFSEDGQIMRNIDSDDRVRPSFKDTGTKTGRLSCSEPNLQQLPKPNEDFPIESRSAFVVEPSERMIVSDFSGQEIRVMAQISKDPTLVSALNNGYDMHLAIANQFYKLGIPEECLNTTHTDYEMWKKKFKKERFNAKSITFGLCYGKGAYGFAKDFGCSETEAQKIVDEYFSGMPLLKKAIDNAHQEVKENGYVTYISGRRRHFQKIEKNGWEGYSKKSLRQAFNACIQGYSADMMRMAMNSVRAESKKHPEYKLKILATVHDEIIVSVDRMYEIEASEMVKRAMEECVKFCVPIVADTEIVKNYGEAK